MLEYYGNVAAGGALMGCIYALIAAGLTLVFGVMRMVNIAHGEMVVIGMYIGYWAYELAGLSTLPALLIAAPTLFLFGYVLQYSVVNRMLEQPIQMQFLLYISLALIITGLHAMLFSPNGRSILSPDSFAVYSVLGLRLDANKAQAAAAALVLLGLLWLFLRTTLVGKAIRGCAENRIGARVIGIRVKRIFAITSGIGIACAGAAGALIAPLFDTQPYLGPDFTLLAFVIVIFGGLGSFGGALLGGIVVGVAESLAAALTEPSLKSMFSFGLLILVLLVRPYGLFGKRGVA